MWVYMLNIVNNYVADFSSISPSIRRNKIYFAKLFYLMFSSSCEKKMTENPDISKNLVSQNFGYSDVSFDVTFYYYYYYYYYC